MKPLSQIFPYGNDRDEKAIKEAMWKWLNDEEDYRSFSKMLYDTCWEVNNGGKGIKYLHFSERKQRVYLDRNFFAWAQEVSDEQHRLFELQTNH